MSQPAIPPTPSAAGLNTARVALLVVDDAGKVVLANPEAKAIWQAGADELVGEFFPSLFALDIVSDEPEMLAAQWDIILGALLEKRAILAIQPKEGSPRPMAVRAARALGALGGYFVTIEDLPPSRAAGAPADEPAAALQLFAESGPVGFFDLNLATRKVLYSPAWKRLLGYGDTELADTYDAWLGLLHPEDSAAAPDKAGRKFKVGPRPFSVEFRMRHQRGHWVWIHCVGLQMASATGQLERVLGLHLDATERKEVEEELATSDARLRALADEGSLAAFDVDFTGGRSWFSDAWVRLVGGVYSPVSGPDALADVLPPEECPGGVEEWILSQAPGHAAFCRLLRLRTADGRPVPAAVGFHRTMSRRRLLDRVVGYAVPLPEAALAEAAGPPRTAAAPLDPLTRTLFDQSLAALSEGLIATDAKGIVLFANPAASRLLQIPAEGIAGRTLDQVFPLVERQTGRSAESLADRVLSSNGPLNLIADQSVRTEGGPVIPVVWSARAAYGTDGKPRGIVVAFRNPEELTLTPDELIKANRFESLGLLAGGVAHDFNNLLTTILGGVTVAKDNRDASLLPDAEKACLAAKALTKQLLLFAKGQSGSLAATDPKEILDDAVKVATVGAMVEVTIQVAPGTGLVKVDRGQMLQVFQNLIVNAIQAMPPPPHRPRVQLKAAAVHLPTGQIASLNEGDYVEFEVRDNGSGIPPEILERIWDPFFTTKKHGSGLGLATVLSIVRKLGGEIGVLTALGEGTVFSIFLPRVDQPSDVQAHTAPSQRFSTGRVLFMDDDPHICALTATMLESLNYKFDLAKNGEEALALYRHYLELGRPYDAVVMDLTVIGGLGGEETFRLLHDLDPDVRAIVSSGYDNEDIARQYLDLGFCGYLTKPYRVTDLGKVLKAVLS